MSKEAKWVSRVGVALILLLGTALALPGRQDSAAPATQAPEQNSPQATAPEQGEPQNGSDGAAAEVPAVPAPAADLSSGGDKADSVERSYSLTSSYSVTLSGGWAATSESSVPPPAPLSPYAPFHLSGNLVLANASRGAILQFAVSNNPFIGHDAYWLDTQMHSPGSSGMSLLDLLFYYFFPPSDACIHEVLTTYAPASRVSPMDGPPYMQVYYSCPLSDTLSDFYAAQVSAGVTFQLTDNGTRVLAPVGAFYVAPMEQVDESGMTFFVFEAQGMNGVPADAAGRFHLPENAPGGQPDFFWAIGAPSPFPFVADADRKDVEILHVAYARLGVDADARAEFLDVLRQIRSH